MSEMILRHVPVKLKKYVNRETVAYFICGVFTSVVGFVVFVAAIFAGIDIIPANTVSTAAAVIFAFVVNKKYVFLSSSWRFAVAAREFASFCGSRVVSYFAETGALVLLVEIMHANELISKMATVIMVVAMNYVFGKLIFKKLH